MWNRYTKTILHILWVFAIGFAGGATGTIFMKSRGGDVIRAHRFELIDSAGRTSAFLGTQEDQPVLIFVGNQGGGNASSLLHQRALLGVAADGTPILQFRSETGTPSVRLYGNAKPVLLLGNNTGVRVSLGLLQSDTPSINDDDWGLTFRPELATIGVSAVSDPQGKYYRGFVTVRKERKPFPD